MIRSPAEDSAATKTKARAAVVAAAICCCGMTFAASAIAEPPPDFDLSNHPAPALAPGVGIGIYDGNNQPVDTCTAGWLIHDSNGQPGLLTAGHCDDDGAVTYFNEAKGFQVVGSFTHKALRQATTARTTTSPCSESATPRLTRPCPPTRASSGSGRSLRPPTSRIRREVSSCVITASSPVSGTARPECGPVVEVQPNTVRFGAHVTKGDSGGPVYYRNADGTATPVGITIRAGDDGGTVAELIGPWLMRWHLRLDGP